jgi:PAT family beta-lactamase induction signal transducer AmpG
MYSKFFIGFSCGVPFLLTLTVLDLWLKDCGVSNTAIGLFTLFHWPFTLKFLWAPFIDRLNFPFLSRKFGQRRGWAIASQLLLFAGLMGMSASNPNSSLVQLILCASVVAFADGCQDMSLYAYQIQAKKNMFGPIAGMVLFGYRIGMFFSKSASLYLAHYFGWNAAYSTMAFSVFLCMFFVLQLKEPIEIKTSSTEKINDMVKLYRQNDSSTFELVHIFKATIFECLVCPFKIFMCKDGWKKLIAIVILFKAGDIMSQKMAKPFYVEIGFSILDIANVVQVFGTVAALVGGVIGGYLVKKLGMRSCMIFTGIAHALSCLAYVALSIVGNDVNLLYFTVFIENVTGGAMGTAFIAFIYSICDKQYCATQYALLWAFYDFGGTICRIVSGALADILGWTNFFLLVPLMFAPSIWLLYSMENNKTKETVA